MSISEAEVRDILHARGFRKVADVQYIPDIGDRTLSVGAVHVAVPMIRFAHASAGGTPRKETEIGLTAEEASRTLHAH